MYKSKRTSGRRRRRRWRRPWQTRSDFKLERLKSTRPDSLRDYLNICHRRKRRRRGRRRRRRRRPRRTSSGGRRGRRTARSSSGRASCSPARPRRRPSAWPRCGSRCSPTPTCPCQVGVMRVSPGVGRVCRCDGVRHRAPCTCVVPLRQPGGHDGRQASPGVTIGSTFTEYL